MKIEKLSPDQTVFDVHSHRMGNTTIRTIGCWSVSIKAVDLPNKRVLASWNGNPPQYFYGTTFKWRAVKPLMIRTCVGGHRMATRAEIKAAKEVKQAVGVPQ